LESIRRLIRVSGCPKRYGPETITVPFDDRGERGWIPGHVQREQLSVAQRITILHGI
jgi:hypothetical protein